MNEDIEFWKRAYHRAMKSLVLMTSACDDALEQRDEARAWSAAWKQAAKRNRKYRIGNLKAAKFYEYHLLAALEDS